MENGGRSSGRDSGDIGEPPEPLWVWSSLYR